jgi:hypothetical protein
VEVERQQPEQRGHQGIAVGHPADDASVVVIDGIEQRGEGGRRGLENAPKDQRRHEHEREIPQQRMNVHQRRRRGPQAVVQVMRERRQGPKEADAHALVGPPGHQPEVPEAHHSRRISLEEAEHLPEGLFAVGPQGVAAEEAAVPVVVDLQPLEDDRAEQHHDQGEEAQQARSPAAEALQGGESAREPSLHATQSGAIARAWEVAVLASMRSAPHPQAPW